MNDAGSSGPVRLHVLLVEDNERLRRVLRLSLETVGLRVTSVGDAAAALEALACDPTLRVLVSDIRMPGEMDGVQLADRLAAERPDLKILLMTGYSSHETGRYPTLLKPFTLEELREALSALQRA